MEACDPHASFCLGAPRKYMPAGISPDVELALCAHLLVPDMPQSALAQVWEEYRVHATDLADRGASALPLEQLAVRVGEHVYKYESPDILALVELLVTSICI
jgi:hypothetical protein